jgi:hypothetical protein
VIGSTIALAGHGTRRLRGVPGEWPLFLAGEDSVGLSRGPPQPEPTPFRDRISLTVARKAPRVARMMIRAEQAAARTLTRRRVAPRRGG